MDDLTDFYYFVEVVRQGSFAAAGRALNISTAKVSRRMALLEERHNVRLIQRSTRSFEVTEIGLAFYERCVAMLAQAEKAQSVLQQGQDEAQGVLRISVPPALLTYPFQAILNRFMQTHPKVRLYVEMTHRRINVIDEHFDLSIRVRTPPFEDSGLVVKSLAGITQTLVAAPALLAQFGPVTALSALDQLPSLGLGGLQRHHYWHFVDHVGQVQKHAFQPSFMANDVAALVSAARAGLGVVQLPCMYVHEAIAQGELVTLMPEYVSIQAGVLQAAYPTRKGMLPTLRALLDLFEAEIESLITQDIGLVAAHLAT
ncbi:MAG: LysR family transcriptional regulator [Neisseriaceae bacterium]|nr:LysR family transcriptional regulator [Neisseriaceae bacterium]MBP6861203.1 LysR family transcriptional regulator [Neisseriaceae bacterium]